MKITRGAELITFKFSSESSSGDKLQLLRRRRFHTPFEFGASVTVVSTAVAPVITTVDAPTVVLVKKELGSVDKETFELPVVDGFAVE